MNRNRIISGLTAFVFMGTAAIVSAHCDTTGGPIIPEAKTALAKGDVTPVLKWVKAGHEAEIKSAFEKASAVRGKTPEAADLADRYFLDILIRLHRAGEGEPFTGIKDEPASPFMELAEKTIQDGAPDALIKRMSGHLESVVKEKFAALAEAAKTKDQSVEAGRKYVAAYVAYMHTLENVRNAIMGSSAHHAETHPAEAPAPHGP
jgi:hypothetical protein